MITDYRFIQGWFDYEDVFDYCINHLTQKLQRKITIVEIGAWLGKSSFYLVKQHADKGDIFVVDTWQGSPDELETAHKLAEETDIFITFMQNMKTHFGKFIPIRSLSTDAAMIFEDNSLDFIFIDADHSYSGIKADLQAWLPKLTKNGIIAGHDYTPLFPGVMVAVSEKFGEEHIKIKTNCWIYENNAG